MGTVFLSLLNMSITATWIALAVIVLRFLLKKAPKWIMGILWGFVALRLVCPFSIESIFSLIPSTQTVQKSVNSSGRPVISSGLNFIDSGINEYLSDRYCEGVTVPADTGELMLKIAVAVWLLGVLAMLIYTAISFLRIRKKVSEAVKASDCVWQCDRISTPFILGIVKPKIYLPSSMNESDAEYVLSHERAHLRRKDYLWKPLGFILLTVYWFNPVLWLAYVLLCRDIELACDEKVIKDKGTAIKKPYSEALINCSVPRKMIAACPLAFGETGVKERVKSVLNYKKPAFWIIVAAVIVCAVTAVCLLTNPVNTNSLAGKYTVSQDVYCDGVFSYYMMPEAAPTIEINERMEVYEWKDEELWTGGLFKETKLSHDNFEALFNGSEVWQNGESAEKLKKYNKTAFYITWQSSENGIFPYMILQQKDKSVYIVYANVENGEPSCIRWIYTLEPQTQENKKYNPYFNATVLEVYDDSALVEPVEGTDERKSSDKISISLNVISTNPVPALKKGDKIRVVYNGTIAETYPAQIDTVFAIYYADNAEALS